MPPKKENAPKKVAVDKTFGMKNKKGGKGQKQVALIKQQESQKGQSDEAKRKEKEKQERLAKKEGEAKRKEELQSLFQPVQIPQKAPFGVDPSTILCVNFKNGFCERGNRCKFAHDLNIGRKVEKKDIYTDTRDDGNKEETNENWTEEKLRQVVEAKMGKDAAGQEANSKGKDTQQRYDIVCKHFIDAIESGHYGWFWTCTNGVDCKYRHALPPGFVLKSQRKKDEEAEKAREITMEEFLTTERAKLPKEGLTPVTAESFAKWKATRMNKKEAEEDSQRKAKESQAAAGKSVGMSGRDLFTYNPLILEDQEEEGDDDDWDLDQYRKQAMAEKDEEERKRMGAVEEVREELEEANISKD